MYSNNPHDTGREEQEEYKKLLEAREMVEIASNMSGKLDRRPDASTTDAVCDDVALASTALETAIDTFEQRFRPDGRMSPATATTATTATVSYTHLTLPTKRIV